MKSGVKEIGRTLFRKPFFLAFLIFSVLVFLEFLHAAMGRPVWATLSFSLIALILMAIGFAAFVYHMMWKK
jgi:uncharacterized membrane protein